MWAPRLRDWACLTTPRGPPTVRCIILRQGFVQGSDLLPWSVRATLCQIEDEWGVLMMFLDSRRTDRRRTGTKERLAIFGSLRPRRGAELKIMSAVEQKCPGFFTKGVHEHQSSKDWGTDTYPLDGTELSYALGAKGSTRRKLALASACIIEYVGQVAFMSGTKKERRRAWDYLRWLLKQRTGQIQITDDTREDMNVIDIPPNCAGYLVGNRGTVLRPIEEETASYLFLAKNRRGEEKLYVFGATKEGRNRAEAMVNHMISDWSRSTDAYGGGMMGRMGGGDMGRGSFSRDSYGMPPAGNYGGGGRGGGRRSPSYGRSRSQSRSRSHGRRRSRSRDRRRSRSRSRSRSTDDRRRRRR
eukprot:NODE_79_length_2233_cov_113.865385_g58_i0.p2 GENE.NODE_79_length_2233_cov_113.865385_g58_i0~~NODE_79_length_2233_cov_113.865385_g58_i0.p2  ORF type:complete len:357 (+),score=74.73 NODE_79_length_2233_cov_113.865385_g58_i0:864-1934(+)